MHSALTPLPSVAVAVIMAVPALTAVTLPSLSTLTISGALLDQVRVLFAALSGLTVAWRVAVLPTLRFSEPGFSCMPVTSTSLVPQMTHSPFS